MVKRVKSAVRNGTNGPATVKQKPKKATVPREEIANNEDNKPRPLRATADYEDEGSTSSEEEPEWTQDHEAAFLKTLGALKSNKEDIYNGGVKFWDDSKLSSVQSSSNTASKEKKQKPMFLKDYERKIVLEKGGQIEESDEDDDEVQKGAGYYEEQEQIRQELRAKAIGNDDDDDDDLLTLRPKTEEERNEAEADFYDWLKDQGDNANLPVAKDLSTLKQAWNAPDLTDEDKFLRDYLLNKDYDTDVKDDKVPAYEDIVDLDQDDKDLDKQRNYEQKYNFRFEDPDQEFIKQYPRTVSESLRKGNTKRKEKREEYKTRKAEEKEQRKKEIKLMKNMTKKEIEGKLKALRDMTGEDVPLNIDDLQGDFDPKEYDRRMKELFDNKYYGENEELGDEDMEKPVFSDDDDDMGSSEEEEEDETVKEELLDEEEEAVKEEPLEDDDQVGEQGMVSPKQEENEEEDKPAKSDSSSDEEIEAIFRKKPDSKRKRKRVTLADGLKKKKPLFDPKKKTFEEYFNEYYALDYEDIIGDQVTKFKYRKVVPNNFGLDAGEILAADDKQLNAWCSIRKVTSYRADQEEQFDVKAYERRAMDGYKKKKIFTKTMEDMKEEEEDEEKAEEKTDGENDVDEKKKRKRKKKSKNGPQAKEEPQAPSAVPETSGKKTRRKKKKPVANGGEQQKSEVLEEKKTEEKPIPKTEKKKKFKAVKKVSVAASLADSRLKAYGINPKKFKAKLKYGVKKSE